MNGKLHMIELRPDLPALVRFLEGQGLNRDMDEDLGYGAHAWLAAAFGATAPRPYRLLMGRGSPPRLLAYAPHGKEVLTEHLSGFAQPAAYAVCPPGRVTAKPMPPDWQPGRRLAFEVLACPVTRKDDVEKDVFLRQADRTGPEAGLQREEVYSAWLARQLAPAAELLDARLAAFRLVRQLRKGKRQGTERTPAHPLRPQALLTGILKVADGAAFGRLLARGIGRHRAFGYGMLLLRPAP